MTYDLLIGDRAYSSWSLRTWLLFDVFDLPHTVQTTRFYCDAFQEALADYAPARTVPVMRVPDGTVVADTLAIAEELHSRHPDAGLWPSDPAQRATARMLTAEMHAAFTSLRSACPMNLRVAYSDFTLELAVQEDLDRITALWAHAREMSGLTTPWLFGDYTIADAFFAPVAARIATYGLPVEGEAASYVAAQLAHPSFRRWRAMGLVDGPDQPTYAMAYDTCPWPGPSPRQAKAVPDGPSRNTTCPYSGDPVTDYLQMDGETYGFCNAFCRDKTVADPEAWPAFMALVPAR